MRRLLIFLQTAPTGPTRWLAAVYLGASAWLATDVGAASALGRNFALEAGGQLTEVATEVVAGTRSVKGSQTGAATYQPYLRTNPGAFRLVAGRSYRVNYRYKILTQGDRGFEVLFYSPTAAAAGSFLNTTQVNGVAGATGTGTLTSRLGSYDDYQLRWNVVGRGAIAIDAIEIIDVATGTVLVTEDVEGTAPVITLAQAALPPAQVGRTFATTLAAVGGRPPYRWSAGILPLPTGLQLESDGHLSGRVTTAGQHVFDLAITDAANATARVTLGLSATAAAALPAPVPLASSDGFVTSRPTPYAAAFRNPLGGMRPELPAAWTHPFASLGRQYIEWNLIENSSADTVEKIRAVTDRLFGELPAYNIKAIPRVYLIWPDPLAKYWPADLAADNYTSAAFRARMRRLIARLGEAWDNDPRIAYIEMGIIGHWGEHHSPAFASSGSTPALPVEMEAEFGAAFRAAFPTKKLMRRNPRDLTGYGFGVHWDVFGALDTRNGHYANDTTPMTRELEAPEHFDLWKTAPRGGEVSPPYLGEAVFTAAAQRSVVRNHTPRLIEIIRRLHWNHLAVLEQLDRSDAEIWDKASQIQNALGYRFVIDEAEHSVAVPRGGGLFLRLKVSNAGSSAFHYPWPLEIALADARTRKIAWRALWDGQDLRTWLPGETISLSRTFALPMTLASGQYVVTLAILDPAGLVPAARFAVNNYWMGGRTPLGPVAVDAAAPTTQLNEFDDLQTDNSLYYLPPTEVAAAPAIILAPVARTAGTGQSVTLTVAAAGTALSYQWFRDGQPVAGATGSSLTLANVRFADAGDYTVVVSNAAGSVTSAAARLTVTSSRLANLSVLSSIDHAGESFTLGYVVGGGGTSGAKPLVVRAVGPSLATFGIAGALADPRLEVVSRGQQVAVNDNWGGGESLATAMAAVGAFSFAGPTSRDAAAALSVASGDGTMVVSSAGSGAGAVLAEIYDATPSAGMTGGTPRLINLSVLKQLGTGFSLGFVVEGSVSRDILIRAIGPTLRTEFAIADGVIDARIALMRGGTTLASNDNWGGANVLRTAFAAVGAFALPAASRDAALVATVAPGDHTVAVSGVGGATGTILVEIYELP